MSERSYISMITDNEKMLAQAINDLEIIVKATSITLLASALTARLFRAELWYILPDNLIHRPSVSSDGAHYE